MARHNLTILLISSVLSLVCYRQALMSRYGATLSEALSIIDREYIEPVDSRILFEGAMDGMMNKLDPYSGYTPPDEYNQFQETMDGEFGGIGIVVEVNQETGRLTVLSPLVGTPAYKAGLRSGDTILAIDDHDTEGMSLPDSVKLMRGGVGSKVKVRIQHASEPEPVEYELARANIPIESVLGDARRADGTWVYHLVDRPRIGYVRIINFGERTGEELKTALQSFREPGQQIDGLIIDLRGNAGGLLNAAQEVCDAFLDHGVIVTTRGRNGVERERREASLGTELPDDVPLVVLIDKYSASASEIVAACLQDHERAMVVGQRSWGKGTVQNVISLEGGRSALRLTIGSYWRPSGHDIHKREGAKDTDDWGVRPDPGQEVNFTNQEFETVVLARRRRDVTSYEDLIAAKTSAPRAPAELPAPESPPLPSPPTPSPDELAAPSLDVANPPVPVPDAESDDPAIRQAEQRAAANALKDPATIDAQLKQAIQRLEEEIRLRAGRPQSA
ncbi:MAG TPA: S41 family peptidase [Pirellulaceae bacterium]|nr:S41 family peptidase [Pirellulaceae bacterium]